MTEAHNKKIEFQTEKTLGPHWKVSKQIVKKEGPRDVVAAGLMIWSLRKFLPAEDKL